MAERTIKTVFFSWYDEGPSTTTGKKRRFVRRARRGETVDLPADAIKRGEELGAFVTDEDEQADAAAESSVDASTATASELAEWIEDARPNVGETVDAAGDDPDAARKLLEAEESATGGKPRQGVVDGLNRIIDSAE